MTRAVTQLIAGTTVRFRWVNSGVTPSDIYGYIAAVDETVVDSATMASSGSGHYYYDVTMPTSKGMFVIWANATIDGKPYRNAVNVEVIGFEVD